MSKIGNTGITDKCILLSSFSHSVTTPAKDGMDKWGFRHTCYVVTATRILKDLHNSSVWTYSHIKKQNINSDCFIILAWLWRFDMLIIIHRLFYSFSTPKLCRNKWMKIFTLKCRAKEGFFYFKLCDIYKYKYHSILSIIIIISGFKKHRPNIDVTNNYILLCSIVSLDHVDEPVLLLIVIIL